MITRVAEVAAEPALEGREADLEQAVAGALEVVRVLEEAVLAEVERVVSRRFTQIERASRSCGRAAARPRHSHFHNP